MLGEVQLSAWPTREKKSKSVSIASPRNTGGGSTRDSGHPHGAGLACVAVTLSVDLSDLSPAASLKRVHLWALAVPRSRVWVLTWKGDRKLAVHLPQRWRLFPWKVACWSP